MCQLPSSQSQLIPEFFCQSHTLSLPVMIPPRVSCSGLPVPPFLARIPLQANADCDSNNPPIHIYCCFCVAAGFTNPKSFSSWYLSGLFLYYLNTWRSYMTDRFNIWFSHWLLFSFRPLKWDKSSSCYHCVCIPATLPAAVSFRACLLLKHGYVPLKNDVILTMKMCDWKASHHKFTFTD